MPEHNTNYDDNLTFLAFGPFFALGSCKKKKNLLFNKSSAVKIQRSPRD